jgi:hypothetical protein
MKRLLFAISMMTFCTSYAQTNKTSFTFSDGIFIGGYVDKGAFLNFTGPNMNLVHKNSKFILGMLPSLRIKADNGVTKNSIITPNLGFGVTYCYKKLALQIPFYYNAKTALNNGQWHVGLGIGIRINALKSKNK